MQCESGTLTRSGPIDAVSITRVRIAARRSRRDRKLLLSPPIAIAAVVTVVLLVEYALIFGWLDSTSSRVVRRGEKALREVEAEEAEEIEVLFILLTESRLGRPVVEGVSLRSMTVRRSDLRFRPMPLPLPLQRGSDGARPRAVHVRYVVCTQHICTRIKY